MSKYRSSHVTGKQPGPAPRPPEPAPQPLPASVEAPPPHPWVRFWFTPVDPAGLHRVRLLAGLLFLLWLLPFAGQLDALFGLHGWFDAEAYREVGQLQNGPPAPVGWSLLYLCGSPGALTAFYWLSLAAVVLFTLGLWTRVTSVLTWVVVASFMANPVTLYDGDVLLSILAFYLMVGYVLFGQRGEGQTPAWRLLGPARVWPLDRRPTGLRAGGQDSLAANVTLRLLQVHFAIVMVTSGLHKLQFGDWWSGLALWYAIHPAAEGAMDGVRFVAPFAGIYTVTLSCIGYLILAWQIGFPLFAWRRPWRPVLLGGAVAAWLACAFLYRLPLFGPAAFIFCVSFLTPAEWRRLHRLTERLVARVRGVQQPLVATDGPAPRGAETSSTPSLATTTTRQP